MPIAQEQLRSRQKRLYKLTPQVMQAVKSAKDKANADAQKWGIFAGLVQSREWKKFVEAMVMSIR